MYQLNRGGVSKPPMRCKYNAIFSILAIQSDFIQDNDALPRRCQGVAKEKNLTYPHEIAKMLYFYLKLGGEQYIKRKLMNWGINSKMYVSEIS